MLTIAIIFGALFIACVFIAFVEEGLAAYFEMIDEADRRN